MPLGRRTLLAAPALLGWPARRPALAQAWPSRPIRLIVPYATGGGTDLLARAIAEALRPALPHPVVVENRAGGAGVIGSEVVARAEPDGHTLMAVVSTHVANRYFLPSLPYDPIRDFTPVAHAVAQHHGAGRPARRSPSPTCAPCWTMRRRNPGRVGTGSTESAVLLHRPGAGAARRCRDAGRAVPLRRAADERHRRRPPAGRLDQHRQRHAAYADRAGAGPGRLHRHPHALLPRRADRAGTGRGRFRPVRLGRPAMARPALPEAVVASGCRRRWPAPSPTPRCSSASPPWGSSPTSAPPPACCRRCSGRTASGPRPPPPDTSKKEQ